ncbi:alkaline phosphatase family protein [Streptomyces sp. NPDC054887]
MRKIRIRLRRTPRSSVLLIALALLLAAIGMSTPAHGAGTGTVGVNQMSYAPGEAITVSYTASQPSVDNWVGIYADDVIPDGDPSSTLWEWARSSTGTVAFAAEETQKLTTRGYNVFLFAGSGYDTVLSKKHFWVTAEAERTAQTSVVCTSQTDYGKGQKFSVSYATTKPSTTNWIGIYPEDVTPSGSPATLMYKYAPGGSGTLLFDNTLPTGRYKAHFLANDGYTKLIEPATFVVGDSPATMSQNLIVNGDAECANGSTSGWDAVTLPGWELSGGPTAMRYGIEGGYVGPGDPGPAERGTQLFSGGIAGASNFAQTVDVSSAASQIDGAGVTYNLSGWLGGYTTYVGTAAVDISFLNGSGTAIGTSAKIGPVTPADRGSVTKLLQRTSTGSVPAGARKIRVKVDMPASQPVAAHKRWNMGSADNLSLTLSVPGLAPAVLQPPASTVPQLDHVFVVMMENKDYGEIIGNSDAPHINAMGKNHVVLTNSNGATRPSDPNYWTIAGGSTFGRTDNPFSIADDPAKNVLAQGTFASPHIGQRAEDAGKTWRAYGQDARFPCDIQRRAITPANAFYDPDNVPFMFFKDLKSTQRCEDKLKPLTQLDQDLASVSTTPNFVWFEPNSCNSMHDDPCRNPSSGPDQWVKATTDKIFASPAWQTKKSLLVFTFDEDWTAHTQRIPTIVAGSPGLTKTGPSDQHVTHYSIGRTIEQGLGLRPMTQNDQFALPLNNIWK